MQGGFYALSINPADRDYFIVNVRGQLYILAGLPKGWFLPHFYFCKMTFTFVNFFRAPDPKLSIAMPGNCTKTCVRRTRWRGAKILPYVDDFLLFATIEEEALTLRHRLAKLIDRLRLLRHPTKGFWIPAQVGHHIGINSDTTVFSTRRRHNSPRSRNKPDCSSHELHGTHDGYP
jgi:hypothetical protein